MRKEKLSFQILDDNAEIIGVMISSWLGVIERDTSLLYFKNDVEIKNYIIDKAITYAIAIKSDDYDVSTFNDCFESKEIGYSPGYNIPAEFRNILNDSIDKCISEHMEKNNTKTFFIDYANNIGRLTQLEKAIKYLIKLRYKEHVELDNNLPDGLILKPFEVQLDFNSSVNYFIDFAIRYIICQENDDRDSDMCKEFCKKDYIKKDKYKYHLEKHLQEIVEKNISDFIYTYVNKETDVNILEFHDSKDALLRTINHAKDSIDGIFKEIYSENKDCLAIYKDYLLLFEQSKKRIKYTPTLNPFKTMLTKAKMNYIMKYKDEYIYPFIYDLLVMRFSILMTVTVYNKELNNPSCMAKTTNEFSRMRINKSDDENYLHQQFLELAEILPKDFNHYTEFIIAHYSQVLGSEYKYIAGVLRQLRFSSGEKRERMYEITAYLQNNKISVDEDYFRLLSLDVI